MALVTSDEITLEANRILNCEDDFAVLKLNPVSCTVEDVAQSYKDIGAILKRREAIRNAAAAKARVKLDRVNARLGDKALLAHEKSKFSGLAVLAKEDMVELEGIAAYTAALESQVEKLNELRVAEAQIQQRQLQHQPSQK